MAYDLLIKNGRIVDGSGMPSFHGDVANLAGGMLRWRAEGHAIEGGSA